MGALLGATLALGTQKLSAKMLDTIPGDGDLKVNLSRVLLGKTCWGDRVSALRDSDDAPDLDGTVPRGRGLWETTAAPARVIQCWYATQAEFRAHLEHHRMVEVEVICGGRGGGDQETNWHPSGEGLGACPIPERCYPRFSGNQVSALGPSAPPGPDVTQWEYDQRGPPRQGPPMVGRFLNR